jgi:ABC-type lipoprotein export system ATPase subunit
MTATALAFNKVSKTYRSSAGASLPALHPTSFEIQQGASVAIIGRSGSGKSTLLHLAAGIDTPSSGEIRIDGLSLATLTDGQLTALRRDTIGIVFQFFHLLPHLSVQENVSLPALIAGEASASVQPRTFELLDRVGLRSRSGDRIDKLSGGEKQRVAICRALLRKPRLLLADEPTGNLDDDNSRSVMDGMLDLARGEGSTLVYVTHSAELAALADQTWTLHSGRLERE